MHRMGPRGAKLVEFSKFVRGFKSMRERIRQIETLALKNVASTDLDRVRDQVWEIISNLAVGVGETRIVSGSKALHHVLPELVPPIDREYTLRFFFNHKNLNRGGAKHRLR
jgi:hypothetical protein